MRLHEQRDNLQRKLTKADNELLEIIKWLQTPKFHKPDDWVRCWEVIERVQRIRNETIEIARGFQRPVPVRRRADAD
jgi:hypothetical protein